MRLKSHPAVLPCPSAVLCVAWSHDASLLAAALANGTAVVWTAAGCMAPGGLGPDHAGAYVYVYMYVYVYTYTHTRVCVYTCRITPDHAGSCRIVRLRAAPLRHSPAPTFTSPVQSSCACEQTCRDS